MNMKQNKKGSIPYLKIEMYFFKRLDHRQSDFQGKVRFEKKIGSAVWLPSSKTHHHH